MPGMVDDGKVAPCQTAGKPLALLLGRRQRFHFAGGEKILDEKVNKTTSKQLGSLGSGNHFLELGVNGKGDVGITIHSGSRRAGYDIADWYIRKAKSSFIELHCELGQAYARDMAWATEFALENRRVMLEAALALLGFDDAETAAYLCSMINENHNHAVLRENGRVLHRKGATPANDGELGIIPGNQRDGVYVGRGLGNEHFLCSCSHGAGRTMSRGAARKFKSNEDFKSIMAEADVVCRTDADVQDEAPWAYKDVHEVIRNQVENDILKVVDYFKPIIVVKG